MDNRFKNILKGSLSKEGVNTNTYLNLQFNGNERLLPPDEMNRVLDINERFNTERQSSKFYRIIGKINPIITNVLFNTTGVKDCWEGLNQSIFTINDLDEDKPNLSFGESIKKHLKEIDGWYGYFDPDKSKAALCAFYDMEPKRERFSFTPDITNGMVKNWELTITYPYTTDKNHYMIKGGLIIIDTQNVVVGGRNMVAVSVPVRHNLTEGDTVQLSGTNKDGVYEVKRVGLDNGKLKDYYFCIDVNGLIVDNDSRMNKIYNSTPSEYYFRIFKKIKTKSSPVIEVNDYEVYKLAFSESIFSDDITQFVFNEDIDITDLVDNLNRPLSELYLTVIKTDSNGIFGNVSSGIELPHIPFLNTGNVNTYLKDIPVVQKIHNVSSAASQSFKPLELNVKVTNGNFYGDVVEYNVNTVQEIILSDVCYRFSTVNRETTGNSVVAGPRPEGYYYKAHSLIRIRDFSSYIEQGDERTAGMPDYVVNLGNGKYLWRDLLEIGATDIVKGRLNYPFLNGSHYMYQNYCFDVRRQDPFDNWDLFFKDFPADPIGNSMNNKFKLNTSNNVC